MQALQSQQVCCLILTETLPVCLDCTDGEIIFLNIHAKGHGQPQNDCADGK